MQLCTTVFSFIYLYKMPLTLPTLHAEYTNIPSLFSSVASCTTFNTSCWVYKHTLSLLLGCLLHHFQHFMLGIQTYPLSFTRLPPAPLSTLHAGYTNIPSLFYSVASCTTFNTSCWVYKHTLSLLLGCLLHHFQHFMLGIQTYPLSFTRFHAGYTNIPSLFYSVASCTTFNTSCWVYKHTLSLLLGCLLHHFQHFMLGIQTYPLSFTRLPPAPLSTLHAGYTNIPSLFYSVASCTTFNTCTMQKN